MRPSVALEKHRAKIRAVVLSHHVVNPRVFGSVVHNADTEESDLDILVDTLPGTTLLDLGGLENALEEMLGVRVDVAIAGTLRPRFRNRILAEAQPL